ncbi:ComEC family competence protein, partial [Paracoccus sp. PXZ]
AQRPDILISAQGDAAAVLTPAGRAPSKSRGGSFAVTNWLEADGDAADQAEAAARPLWIGSPSDRWADLERAGIRLRIRHLTGKAAAQDAGAYCREGGILVANAPLSLSVDARKECLVLDPGYLGKRGAVAIFLTEDGPNLISADEPGSGRLWH